MGDPIVPDKKIAQKKRKKMSLNNSTFKAI
jgi:hypothetical protein